MQSYEYVILSSYTDIVWKDGKISILYILHISLDYWHKYCKILVQLPCGRG